MISSIDMKSISTVSCVVSRTLLVTHTLYCSVSHQFHYPFPGDARSVMTCVIDSFININYWEIIFKLYNNSNPNTTIPIHLALQLVVIH